MSDKKHKLSDFIPDMTYSVFGGMLNLTRSINLTLCPSHLHGF